MNPARNGSLLALSLALSGCQLVLGFEEHTLGTGGGGGADPVTSSSSSSSSGGGGASTTVTTTSSSSGGGQGGTGQGGAVGSGGSGGGTGEIDFGVADELVTGRGALLDLAISGTKLYYVVDGAAAQAGSVEALDTTNEQVTTLIPSLSEPRGVAADGTHVYTTSGPLSGADTLCHVLRAPVGGGTAEDVQTATVPGGAGANENCYADVAINATRAFASVAALTQFSSRSHVRSTLLAGGDPLANGRAESDAAPLPALFAAGTNIFWVDPTNGELLRAPQTSSINNLAAGNPPGSAVDTVTTGQTNATDVAVRLDVAYMLSDAGVTRVGALGLVPATATTLTNVVASPRGISVDNTHVYWADGATRQVRAVPIGGGTSELLWQPATEAPIDTVATGTAIFVITAEGTVARIAKTIL